MIFSEKINSFSKVPTTVGDPLFCKGSPYFLRFSVSEIFQYYNKIRGTCVVLVYKNKGPHILYDFRILKLQNEGPPLYINYAELKTKSFWHSNETFY